MPSNNAAERFVEHMLRYTVRLICDATSIGATSSVASGVVAKIPRGLAVLTAGHIFDRPGTWTMETSTVVGSTTLHLPLNEMRLLYAINLPSDGVSDVDLAWALLDIDKVKAQMRIDPAMKGRTLSLPIYTGPLDQVPNQNDRYGFAAPNRVELHGTGYLYSQAAFEIGMVYRECRAEDGLYEFELVRTHQGHEFYSGASGAPISNEEGTIVSLLLSGDPDRNVLWGVPLARYARVLNIDEALKACELV